MAEQKNTFDSEVPNDYIDIHAEPDVKAKKLPSDNPNEFKIELEGKSIDNSVVNAIRRTVMMSIPVYAFHRSNTFIEVKKCKYMYNNDLLYNQIETLPIYDIPNYFDLENPDVFLSNEVLKNLFGNFVRDQYTEEESEKTEVDENKRLFKIELTLNVKNITGNDKFVTTHDAILKIDGKISNSYMIRNPISIIVLKPMEEVSLRSEANLGISKIHAAYEATTIAILEDITPMKYHLKYETLEQLDKNTIFAKACIILVKKLENLKSFIQKKYTEERSLTEKINIELHGEDHTLGNLIATTLQKCAYVKNAGYVPPHPFIDQVNIEYNLKPDSKLGPIRVFIDCIDYLIRLYQLIGHHAFSK